MFVFMMIKDNTFNGLLEREAGTIDETKQHKVGDNCGKINYLHLSLEPLEFLQTTFNRSTRASF